MHKKIALLLTLLGLAVAGHAATSPAIIKTIVLKGQTTSIPPTTIFTPPTSGLFRISVYMVATGGFDNLGNWNAKINWTDDAGPESTVSWLSLNAFTPPNAWAQNSIVIEAAAGEPATISISAGTQYPGPTYSLFLVVEQI
jgi:hypothetical protein